MKGTITAVKKDFGFIRGEDGHDRLFHKGGLLGIAFGEIAEGMSVEFTPYALPAPAADKPRDPSKQHNNLRARAITVLP